MPTLCRGCIQKVWLRHISLGSPVSRPVSYYDDLGVHPGASAKEIKVAFYKLSKDCHPDMNKDNPTALAQFQTISEAYNTLSNPKQRLKYDKGVLKRSSSVAEREMSSHRFQNENFYESRGSKALEDRRKEMDNWVRDHTKETFRHHQYQKKKIRFRREKDAQKGMGPLSYSSSTSGSQSQQDSTITSKFVFILSLLFIVVTVIKNS